MVLVLTGDSASPIEVFHYGQNKSGGIFNMFKGFPDLSRLVATAALTETVMINDRLSEVRWITNIQRPMFVGTMAETPTAVVGNMIYYLREKPELKRPHVFAEDLKSIYRELRYDISPVGVGKLMR
ncbi:hypothetical protein A3J19_02865 [Candidatus Daviesbacteria bacterium RIFCSPLOWO2_02_FULL_41_8]|uniref:Uncharacterized protein n=3 Tax=Candidatus Daviesiibacteriota TaxID=1752718 RepID=A0A1F5NMM0_9BACT|nr:MAG: hypothetical protein A2871_00300 [Candidatus Daviesbacteria bacterium RIFCSPHIGHO2_01_FULL_41_23]OGE33339.1 MAG: hypothetical protein A3D83_03940 [Candidatus Daviesbacteria bacterium RIFCSPHIGHO2_02_FULL_41_10]OGE78762.1 MAG: hypothetical protein A3J19_02865 [Candidatus Daviesbacteria bacterium RIFCSPLOWO2_02_FULL_41_8]